MSRQRLTYQKVASAAKLLQKMGVEPTISNICAELGIEVETPKLSTLVEKWQNSHSQSPQLTKDPLVSNVQVETNAIFEKNIDLEKSLSLLRATLESTADGIMMVNGKGQVVDWNQKFVEMWRIPSYMLESGKESISFEYILEQLSNPELIIADVQYLYENPEWQGQLPLLYFKDGRIFERFTQPQRVGTEVVGRVYSFRDMTQRVMSEDEKRIRERAIEASTHGVAIIDITKPNHPIIYANKAFELISGYLKKQLIGKNITYLQGVKTDLTNLNRLEVAITERREEKVELESYRKNGEIFWCQLSISPIENSFKKVSHYVCFLNDITERREMEKQLILQATHDPLTELPNRVLLIDRVEQAIIQARKKKSLLAFLFLDLDHFKMTNDTIGHTMGDKLLQAVSNRLLIATNKFDTVARLGGDEFVILLPDLLNEAQAKHMAQDILYSIESKPFQIDQYSLKITASIGICYYPKDGFDFESLMKNADLSMYHAKDSGRNNYRVYEEEMKSRVINRMQLDNALHDAIKNNEFFLHYQPIIDLRNKKILGLEALIRWNNHLLGRLMPADFISIAEENSLILDIGKWVLEESCSQIKHWHEQGFSELSIAVNVSGRQFRQRNFPEIVGEILAKTNLSPRFLELELTESLLVDNVNYAVEKMHQLKAMGIKLVIDDFGTGYSSLSYLKQFPLDKLKIDKSFTSQVDNKENEAAIARAIITLGHSLDLEVVAEGVETELQNEFVINQGCDYAQGFYYAHPNNPEAINDYLKNFPNFQN
ncbi:MAG: EAL domain-containing protein [Tatlockia sp.]|nr:EAL domain-containing protein [Tatlockia sp.]